MQPSPSERLKKIRKAVGGISQQKLANQLSIPVSRIKDVESGKNNITTDLALKLEGLSNFNFKWIMTGQGAPLVTEESMKLHGSSLELIGDIIESVENILQEEGTNLAPDKKRRLIELLYKYFTKTGEKTDKGVIREHLRLIAA